MLWMDVTQETPLKCLNACNARGTCLAGWCHCRTGGGDIELVMGVIKAHSDVDDHRPAPPYCVALSSPWEGIMYVCLIITL